MPVKLVRDDYTTGGDEYPLIRWDDCDIHSAARQTMGQHKMAALVAAGAESAAKAHRQKKQNFYPIIKRAFEGDWRI